MYTYMTISTADLELGCSLLCCIPTSVFRLRPLSWISLPLSLSLSLSSSGKLYSQMSILVDGYTLFQ